MCCGQKKTEKKPPDCACLFNLCLISVYLHLSCHEFTQKKRRLPATLLKLSNPTPQQGHAASFSFFFFNLKASHSLYLLFSSLSDPLSLSLFLVSSPHTDVNPNLDFQILKGRRPWRVLERGNWGIGSSCVSRRR